MAKFECVKLMVLVCGFITLLISTGMILSFGVLFSEFLDVFGADKGKTAWIPSIYTGVLTMTGLISGAIINKVGHRISIIGGSLLMTIGITSSAFINNMYLLYFPYGVITGCGASVLHISGNVMIVQHFKKWRSVAVGLASMGGGVGSTVLPYLTNYLINRYRWRGTLILIGGIYLQGVVVGWISGLWPIHKSPNAVIEDATTIENQEQERKSVLVLMKQYFNFVNRNLTLFTFSALLLLGAYFNPYNVVADMMVSRGFTITQGAWVSSSMGFGNMFGRVILGLVSDLVNRRKVYIYMFGHMLACAMTVTFIHIDQFYQYILCGIFTGIGTGCVAVLLAVIPTELAGVENAAKSYGFVITIGGIGAITGSPIAGWITDGTGSYDAAFYFTAGLFLLSGLVALPIATKQQCCSKTQSQLPP